MRASSEATSICHLSRGSDGGGSRGLLGGLLALDGLGDLLLDVGDGLLSGRRGIGGSLRGSLLSLGGLLLDLLGLGGALAVDGGAELGESVGLGLTVGGRGVALAEEGKRRLALLLDVGLGLSGNGLGGLSGGNLISKRGGGVNGRDDGGGLGGGLSLLGSRLGGISSLGLSGLLLLLGEDTTEEAVALAGSGLGGLDSRLLGGLGGGSSLLNGSLLSLGLGGLSLGGHLSDLSGGLLGLGLLLGKDVLLAKSEERSALAAGRAALGLLSLGFLLGSLTLLGGLLGGGGLGGRLSGGSRLSSLDLLLRSGLEALEGVLVSLRLGDGGGNLLGLGNLGLDLSNPVVTLSDVSGLEGVLVALGGQVELVAVNLGLSGVGLDLVLVCLFARVRYCSAATDQVDDVVGGLLVTGEEETLAGVSSPGDVVEGALGGLLGLLVSLEGLGLDGVRAEEEELFATEQVPGYC